MKFAAVLCLLLNRAAMADGGHPDHLAPMPPDPVMVNRVPCAHSCASLQIRKLSQPGDLFIWELLKDTTTLSTAQVRTLALDLLRVRRFYDDQQPDDSILLCAWSERDPVAAAREVVNIPDWEDRDDAIGSYDSDVEYFGIRLWNELARTEFAAARKIAASLKGRETIGQIFSGLPLHSPLSSMQAAEICKLAQRLDSPAAAQEVAGDFLRNYLDAYEMEKARAFPALFPKGPIRDSLQHSLSKRGEWEAAPADPFVFPPVADPELRELKKLDIIDPGRFAIPFALLRKVLAFTPEQALACLAKLAPPQRPEGWLGWMLLMRAMEGDPLAAATMQFPMQLPYWIYLTGTLPGDVYHAATATAPGKQQALRAMSAEERAGALTACMSRVPLEQAREWLAFAREVKAPALASQPLLVRLAASGQPEAAMDGLTQLTVPDATVIRSVMAAWALTDFASATAFSAALPESANKQSVYDGLSSASHRIPARKLLEEWPKAFSLELMEQTDQFFIYLALEDREAGFRFLEERRSDPAWPYLAGVFANAAIRHDPDRVLKLMAGIEVDRGLCLQGIAIYWPERLREFLRPDSDEKTWAAVASKIAHARPDSLLETLRGVEFTSAWDTAGSILGLTRPDLMKKIAPHMSEAARYRVMVEKRR